MMNDIYLKEISVIPGQADIQDNLSIKHSRSLPVPG
jgi:hypothetical protein